MLSKSATTFLKREAPALLLAALLFGDGALQISRNWLRFLC
jgi:hypothetical protein